MTQSSSLLERLLGEIAKIPVIDTHEHLCSEKERLAQDVDALVFFTHYTMTDLLIAGYVEPRAGYLLDTTVPLEERWRSIARVLAEKVEEGYFTEEEALAYARDILRNNPIDCYRLEEKTDHIRKI